MDCNCNFNSHLIINTMENQKIPQDIYLLLFHLIQSRISMEWKKKLKSEKQDVSDNNFRLWIKTSISIRKSCRYFNFLWKENVTTIIFFQMSEMNLFIPQAIHFCDYKNVHIIAKESIIDFEASQNNLEFQKECQKEWEWKRKWEWMEFLKNIKKVTIWFLGDVDRQWNIKQWNWISKLPTNLKFEIIEMIEMNSIDLKEFYSFFPELKSIVISRCTFAETINFAFLKNITSCKMYFSCDLDSSHCVVIPQSLFHFSTNQYQIPEYATDIKSNLKSLVIKKIPHLVKVFGSSEMNRNLLQIPKWLFEMHNSLTFICILGCNWNLVEPNSLPFIKRVITDHYSEKEKINSSQITGLEFFESNEKYFSSCKISCISDKVCNYDQKK